MKYIRAKDGIYEFRKLVDFETYLCAKRYDENSVTLYQIEQKEIMVKALYILEQVITQPSEFFTKEMLDRLPTTKNKEMRKLVLLEKGN